MPCLITRRSLPSHHRLFRWWPMGFLCWSRKCSDPWSWWHSSHYKQLLLVEPAFFTMTEHINMAGSAPIKICIYLGIHTLQQVSFCSSVFQDSCPPQSIETLQNEMVAYGLFADLFILRPEIGYSAQWDCRKSQLMTINHYEISIKHWSYHYKPKINRYAYPSLNYSDNIKWYIVEDLPMCQFDVIAIVDVFVKIYGMRQVGKSPTYQPKLYKPMLAYN